MRKQEDEELDQEISDFRFVIEELQQELDKYKKITEALEIMEDTYLPEETDFILLTKKDYLKHEKELPTKEHIMLELVDRNTEVLNLKKELDKYKAKEKELRDFILKPNNFIDYKGYHNDPEFELKELLDILDRKDK